MLLLRDTLLVATGAAFTQYNIHSALYEYVTASSAALKVHHQPNAAISHSTQTMSRPRFGPFYQLLHRPALDIFIVNVALINRVNVERIAVYRSQLFSAKQLIKNELPHHHIFLIITRHTSLQARFFAWNITVAEPVRQTPSALKKNFKTLPQSSRC